MKLRTIHAATLAAALMAGAAMAQTSTQTSAQTSGPAPYVSSDTYRDQRSLPTLDPSDPKSRDAWLQARGEAYRRAPDSAQTEQELRTTQALNDEIAAQNTLADKADEAARLEHDAAVARYQIELRQTQERARAEAEATRAAQNQYDRDYAAWRDQVQRCQSGDRSACATPAPRPR
ncbi:hypothetical protein [Brevundimonas sp.]|uniref:hypothetical protein n=1 Tax=Brevundimonas sp. TaxID=1871086 RepID=UPI0025B82166|nr:hypothetical protein [Brevundimonas sp.]